MYRRLTEIFLSLLALVAIALILNERLTWLFSKDYPNATDSFYYLKELKHRLSTGEGYYVKHSLFFSFWTVIGRVFSISELVLHDVIFLSNVFLFACSIFLFLKNRADSWSILAVIAIYLSSDVLFYRTFAFLKQSFAVGLLSLGLSVVSLQRAKENLKLKIFGILLVCFAGCIHIFAAAVSLACLPFVFNTNKKNAILAGLSGLIIAFVLAMQKNTFAVNSIFDSGWWGSCEKLQCPSYEYFEFFLYSLIMIISAPVLFYKNVSGQNSIFIYSFIIFIFVNLPFWTSFGDMRERLAFSSVWLFFITFCGAIRLKPKEYGAISYIALISITCCFNYFQRRSYDQELLPIRILERSSSAIKDWIERDSFILAKHGHEFILSYFVDRRSADTLPIKTPSRVYYQLKPHIKGLRENSDCVSVDTEYQKKAECLLIDRNWLIRKVTI